MKEIFTIFIDFLLQKTKIMKETTKSLLHLQCENYMSYIIHHHTKMPEKEGIKYHLYSVSITMLLYTVILTNCNVLYLMYPSTHFAVNIILFERTINFLEFPAAFPPTIRDFYFQI